jgi:hypothetical protein
LGTGAIGRQASQDVTGAECAAEAQPAITDLLHALEDGSDDSNGSIGEVDMKVRIRAVDIE